MKPLLVLVAVLALAGPAEAAVDPAKIETRYTPNYTACMNAPENGSTWAMVECIKAELKVQDARLNVAYRDAVAKLTDRQKAALQAAQRAWVAFRDADCRSLFDDEWGSLSRISANSCVLDRTIERTIELEAYPDGD